MSERCRIILRCADGIQSKVVAADLGVHEHTVGKWRRRFLTDRVEGLLDEARPGRPRTIEDDQVAAVIERTLRSKPVDATHWSIRSMSGATGFSHTTIRRIWAAFGLQPHRSETFKLSSDPLFVDKVRDIVGLYLSPPNRALVLSVDEKSQIQALDREQPILPMMPGMPSAASTANRIREPRYGGNAARHDRPPQTGCCRSACRSQGRGPDGNLQRVGA
jgi:transposase